MLNPNRRNTEPNVGEIYYILSYLRGKRILDDDKYGTKCTPICSMMFSVEKCKPLADFPFGLFAFFMHTYLFMSNCLTNDGFNYVSV